MMAHDDEQMRVHQVLLPGFMNYAEAVRGAAHTSFEFGNEP